MRNKIKIAVVVAAIAAALLVFGQSRQHAQTTTPSQVMTAGQKFKNIKVLNDMPADQLGKVMNIFAASLGVDCNFCHNTKDYSLDEKKEKETARKMITMTFGINKASFDGRTEVSCNTCHNGREHPLNQPSLVPVTHVERPKQPEKKPLADDIVANYIKAVGGADKISMITSRTITATRVEPDGKTEPETIYYKDGKYSTKVTYGERWVSDLYDGREAAKFGKFQKIDITPDDAEQIKRDAQLFRPTDLKTIYPKMEFRFLDRIDGRDVYVVQATTASNVRERLYFDAASGFLVRRVVATPTVLGNFVYQVDYSDYKSFDGVMLPTTIKESRPNIIWTKKITAVKNNAAIDDSVFKVTVPEPRPAPKN
jgi:photosynthetic reaction center cytochrome c subunit